ncbi:hypothetical protein AYI69_g5014 [Smittium culicis]|uniref:Uncharacterized protein n=1 Tax=Smittium culicis TaxID=133412 RepID=A0A1R1Y9Q2_9FUNG|nr:hypothetical protein AYI69_g5014 [Smittium culicis]
MTITKAIRSCSPSCFYNLDRIEKSRLCKRFVDYCKKISNGDTECIVKYTLFSSRPGRSIGNDIFSLNNDKMKNIINNISKLHSSLSTSKYQKSTILSLVSSEFSPSQLSSFGFEFSRTQFNTAKQKASEDQFTLDDYQRHIPKSRSTVGQTVVDLVKSYLHRYSQPSTITGRRVGQDSDGLGTPVMYLTQTKSYIYHQLLKENPGLKLGLSTFYNVCPKNFKKPTKRTDMCKVCVAGLNVEKMYRSVVSSHGIDSEGARKLMKTYQDFKDHKMLVNEQRGRFTSLEENLENHGKSYVDGHFGVLSKWFDESESIMDITSIDDLLGIFRSKTSDLAAQRGVYTDNFGYKFIKYDQYTPRGYKYTMCIDGFKNYLMACPIRSMSPSDYEPKNFRLNSLKILEMIDSHLLHQELTPMNVVRATPPFLR